MTRYSTVPWPWAGLVLTLALLGQEVLFRWLGNDPSLTQTLYRIAVMAIGVSSLALILLPPRKLAYLLGFILSAGLMVAGGGGALAARHVWLQSLPPDQVPACGMGISYMIESMPFLDVLKKVYAGSGECAEKGWEFLGLAIPGWTFVFFIAITIVAFALIKRD